MKLRHIVLLIAAAVLLVFISLSLGGSSGHEVLLPTSPPAAPLGVADDDQATPAPRRPTKGEMTQRRPRTPTTVTHNGDSPHEIATTPTKKSTRNNKSKKKDTALLNGVLLLLQGGRWGEDYLLRHNLPRLERFFLRCFQYPVIVFHEGISTGFQQGINAAIPSANHSSGVHFEDVSAFWKKLPHGVAESQLKRWMTSSQQRTFQGRGYRLMCRFWHGLVWSLPVLDSYEYYWRLDTDAYLTTPVKIDPFQLMARDRCEYGFNRLKGDAPGVVIDLWPTFEKWARLQEDQKKGEHHQQQEQQQQLGDNEHDYNRIGSNTSSSEEGDVDGTFVAQHLSTRGFKKVKEFSLDRNGAGEYLRRMYYNNFELGTMRLKRHPIYTSFFKFVDTQEPFGILRYRWGDAPLHTLGVVAVLWEEALLRGGESAVPGPFTGDGVVPKTICKIGQDLVGYKHAVKKPPPIDTSLQCGMSPPQ